MDKVRLEEAKGATGFSVPSDHYGLQVRSCSREATSSVGGPRLR